MGILRNILYKFNQACYVLFYYRLFSNAIAIRKKDTILGSIYSRMMRWPEIVKLQDKKYSLLLPKSYAKIQVNEYGLWEKWYGKNFEGKTVMDIGAGAGETASFFFNHGAKKVICIEKDENALKYLYWNSIINNWNTEIIACPFLLRHLEIPHDYLKLDVEGAEIILLNYKGKLGPCSMELHPEEISKRNTEKLITRFNLKPIMKPRIFGLSS